MKTEDSVNQSLNEVGAPQCMSGSNYGEKGRRIKVLSLSWVPLLGLMLLATLPFGASIKQSVPRVKLSHRGKNRKKSDNVIVYTFFYALMLRKMAILAKTFYLMSATFIICMWSQLELQLKLVQNMLTFCNWCFSHFPSLKAMSRLVSLSATFCLPLFPISLVLLRTQPRQKWKERLVDPVAL